MSEQKKLERAIEINKNANHARLVLDIFEPIIKDKHDVALNHMKADFRDGKLDNTMFIKYISKMTAYDDLLNELNHAVNKSLKKEQEILNANRN